MGVKEAQDNIVCTDCHIPITNKNVSDVYLDVCWLCYFAREPKRKKEILQKKIKLAGEILEINISLDTLEENSKIKWINELALQFKSKTSLLTHTQIVIKNEVVNAKIFDICKEHFEKEQAIKEQELLDILRKEEQAK